jgi:hypothetical protein
MGLLVVLAAGRPDRVSGAEQVRGKKVEIAVPVLVTLRVKVTELEGLHIRPRLTFESPKEIK